MSVTCSICFENINFSGQEVSVLNCGHLYHSTCLLRWLESNLNCPECKVVVTMGHFIKKIFPKTSENVYEGSSADTKTILKVYEESTKNVQEMFVKRIATLESQNSKLTEDLRKSSNETNKLKWKIMQLELKKEHAKFREKEVTRRLETQIKKLKNKLSSMRAMLQDESDSTSNDEGTPSTS